MGAVARRRTEVFDAAEASPAEAPSRSSSAIVKRLPKPRTKRDSRIDVLRGLALLMIFVDHIPADWLGYATLHNFALCDAAEVFVFLAGYSATLAYGSRIDREGWKSGISKLAQRCGQIYLAQVLLLVSTLVISQAWLRYFHLATKLFASFVEAPVSGLAHAVVLTAQPGYLDILPLYIVLLAAFPLIHLALKKSAWVALLVSGSIWLAASVAPGLNLPNWVTQSGWFFDPFSWQFLLTLGAFLAKAAKERGGNLPWRPTLVVTSALFLLVTIPMSIPWSDWGLAAPWSAQFQLPPLDKTHLAWPRIASVLAIVYLVLSSGPLRCLSQSAVLRPIAACGRHSLEVFSAGCLFALCGRLLFRTFGAELWLQLAVNVAGMAGMLLIAQWTDRRQAAQKEAAALASATA